MQNDLHFKVGIYNDIGTLKIELEKGFFKE